MRINARWVAAAVVFAAVTGVTAGSVAASAATPSQSGPAAGQQDRGGKDGEARKCVVPPGKKLLKEPTKEQRAKIKERLEAAAGGERPKLLEGLPGEPRPVVEEVLPRGLGEKIRKKAEGEKVERLGEEDRVLLKERIREGGKVCHARGDAKDEGGKRIGLTDDAVVKALASKLKVGEDDVRRAVKTLAGLGERPGGVEVDSKEFAAVAEELGVTAERLKGALAEAREELRGHKSVG